MKATETAVRDETSLQPTLDDKNKQLKKLQQLLGEVSEHEAQIDSLPHQAEELSEGTGDKRPLTQATQLKEKYHTMADTLQVRHRTSNKIY